MNRFSYFRLIASISGALCVALFGDVRPARAQTAFPMIISTYPTGVQRGKTTDVTVTAGVMNGGGGNNLYGAYKALFEGEGVKAEVIPPEKGWPAKDPKKPNELPSVPSVTVRVTVAADAPLGVREFRMATARHGSSTVGLLTIGDEPEVNEVEPNNDAEHAQSVAIPCVVNGRIQQGEDVDCFKITATAGQEVTFAVQCARLEDKIHDLAPHADPLLILKDMAGNELGRNDDFYRADPLLHYKFEKAGAYVVQIRDVGYQGNPNWVYRLNITSRPYVIAATPCAVRPGQSVDLHVVGFNLGGLPSVHLDVPANLPNGPWNATLKFPNGTSNLVPLLISDAPQLAVFPPTTGAVVNAALKSGASIVTRGALALPGGVNSSISAPGEVDRYTFHAKKGEPWGFEVTARRLDSEMDSEIKLRDAKGNVLAENDDLHGKDSGFDWTAPADGDYSIDIRDLAGHAGPTYYYNLSAHPLRPDFRLKCDTDRAMIAPGNRTAWFVILERKYGFTGEVKMEVKGLPAGVTVAPLTIPTEMTQGPLIFTAAPDAKIDLATVEVVGTATLNGPDGKPAAVSHKAIPLTEIYMPGGGRGQYEVDTQGIAVTDPNDLVVTSSTPTITLAPGGTAKIEVEIKRQNGYTKPVTLDLRINHLGGVFTNPLPPGVTVDDGAAIAENQTKGTITLHASNDAHAIQNWPLAVMANVSVNFVMKVWFVTPVTLTVTPPPAKK